LGARDGNCGYFETERVPAVFNGNDIPPGQDAVRPLLLVGTQCALLVVHDLKQMLDQFQPHDAVVGSPRISEEVGTVSGGLGINCVDEFRVEDGVDAVKS
jgi:hypothetical protein